MFRFVRHDMRAGGEVGQGVFNLAACVGRAMRGPGSEFTVQKFDGSKRKICAELPPHKLSRPSLVVLRFVLETTCFHTDDLSDSDPVLGNLHHDPLLALVDEPVADLEKL